MNQVQRKFLIDKITEKAKENIERLRKQVPEYPSITNYLFAAALRGDLEIQPNEVILAEVKKKALGAVESRNWMSDESMGWSKLTHVKIATTALFVLPKDYEEALAEYKAKVDLVKAEVDLLTLQLDSLITRIQLSSDRALETIISEVDDMGAVSLIDTRLKLLLK